MLVASACELTAELPDLRVQGLWGRYETGLACCAMVIRSRWW